MVREEIKKAYPNWREIIEANNQKPPMWLRVNLQKRPRNLPRFT